VVIDKHGFVGPDPPFRHGLTIALAGTALLTGCAVGSMRHRRDGDDG